MVVVASVAAGCANSRSILYSGISGPLGQTKKVVVTDAAAARDARQNRAEWLAMIARVRRQGAAHGFSNLSPRKFRLRLAAAAKRYGFTVKKVQFVHPGHVAPLVIVQTHKYLAFARAVPAIEKSLDPHKGRSDLAGWAFEAFYLEAQDERGVPFLVVTNVVGGGGVTGGQWARSDPLFPFAHG
jgi:hypothetical protein